MSQHKAPREIEKPTNSRCHLPFTLFAFIGLLSQLQYSLKSTRLVRIVSCPFHMSSKLYCTPSACIFESKSTAFFPPHASIPRRRKTRQETLSYDWLAVILRNKDSRRSQHSKLVSQDMPQCSRNFVKSEDRSARSRTDPIVIDPPAFDQSFPPPPSPFVALEGQDQPCSRQCRWCWQQCGRRSAGHRGHSCWDHRRWR